MKETNFYISGYESRKILCNLYEPKGCLEHIVVMLPGGGYPLERPLFYYPTDMLLARKLRVLHINVDDSKEEKFRAFWRQNAMDEVDRWRAYEASQIASYLKANYSSPVTLMGMSAGSRIMTTIQEKTDPVQSIWLSPSLGEGGDVRWKRLKANKQDIVIVGSEDNNEAMKAHLPSQTLTITGGNHSLEMGDNVYKSIDVLKAILRHIEENLVIRGLQASP